MPYLFAVLHKESIFSILFFLCNDTDRFFVVIFPTESCVMSVQNIFKSVVYASKICFKSSIGRCGCLFGGYIAVSVNTGCCMDSPFNIKSVAT